jgi:hypothetical protein
MKPSTNGFAQPARAAAGRLAGPRAAAAALLGAAALAFAPLAAAAAAEAGSKPPVEVMVLGTYHMGNPGLDLNNVKADDVTTTTRQRELAALADALAKFRPTKIALEFVSDAPDRAVAEYARFTPAELAKSRDERVQIGFRLAKQLGHAAVYGIDEQSETVDYFPFDRLLSFAQRTKREADLAGPMELGRRYVADLETRLTRESIAGVLAWMNDPADVERQHAIGYLGVLPVGAGGEQPGAELNAMWFLRNAKIFAKLAEIAQPGDRVLVVYGAGHNYWLRHLARETPGFALVEANPYLGAR